MISQPLRSFQQKSKSLASSNHKPRCGRTLRNLYAPSMKQSKATSLLSVGVKKINYWEHPLLMTISKCSKRMVRHRFFEALALSVYLEMESATGRSSRCSTAASFTWVQLITCLRLLFFTIFLAFRQRD